VCKCETLCQFSDLDFWCIFEIIMSALSDFGMIPEGEFVYNSDGWPIPVLPIAAHQTTSAAVEYNTNFDGAVANIPLPATSSSTTSSSPQKANASDSKSMMNQVAGEIDASLSTEKTIRTSIGLKSPVELLVAFEAKQRVDLEFNEAMAEKEMLSQRLRSQLKVIANHRDEFINIDDRFDMVIPLS
jgi:hypothetical protein